MHELGVVFYVVKDVKQVAEEIRWTVYPVWFYRSVKCPESYIII